VLLLLVKLGATASVTTSVNACDAEPALLSALREIAYVPLPVAGTLPEMVPVPFPLSVKFAPLGRPVAESAGVGTPVAVTGNEKAVPGGTVSVLALVITGACATWMVKVVDTVVPCVLPGGL
jgi:hypothetical protein